MGWTWDTGYGPAYAHEGYAAAVLDDGTVTGTHDALTNGRFVGWRAACDCGWRGPGYWSRAEALATDPAYRASVERYPAAASIAPDSVEGDEDGDGALGQWRAHLATAVPALAVHDAAQRLTDAREQLDQAVRTARSSGTSWAAIGDAAGMTRQAAHERWGDTPAATASTRRTR